MFGLVKDPKMQNAKIKEKEKSQYISVRKKILKFAQRKFIHQKIYNQIDRISESG